MREATPAEWAAWDDLVAAAPGGHSFWQLPQYAAMKSPGWHPRPTLHRVGDVDIPVLYLVRTLPLFGQYWYAPMGPRVATVEQLDCICDDLRRHSPAFAVVMEPSLPSSGPDDKAAVAAQIPGLAPVGDVQLGAHTVVVDLTVGPEALLASFKQRTRRAIRKAEKDGAVVEHVDDDSVFDDFWDLYRAMTERAGIDLPQRSYYERAWRIWLDAGKGHFVMARPRPGAPYAAGAFMWHDRHEALYKDGGSLRVPEANGLQYLVQWECMRWAMERGCPRYDMFGMPPSWRLDDETHSMHGLVQFKTGFGPVTDHVGALVLARAPRRYRAWERVGRRAFNAAARVRPTSFY